MYLVPAAVKILDLYSICLHVSRIMARSTEVFAKISQKMVLVYMTHLSLVMSEYLKSPEEQSSVANSSRIRSVRHYVK